MMVATRRPWKRLGWAAIAATPAAPEGSASRPAVWKRRRMAAMIWASSTSSTSSTMPCHVLHRLGDGHADADAVGDGGDGGREDEACRSARTSPWHPLPLAWTPMISMAGSTALAQRAMPVRRAPLPRGTAMTSGLLRPRQQFHGDGGGPFGGFRVEAVRHPQPARGPGVGLAGLLGGVEVMAGQHHLRPQRLHAGDLQGVGGGGGEEGEGNAVAAAGIGQRLAPVAGTRPHHPPPGQSPVGGAAGRSGSPHPGP